MTLLRYRWSAADIFDWLAPKYEGVKLPAEAPITVLRLLNRRARPGLRPIPNGLFKNIPAERPSFELLEWRRPDKQFRWEHHKENQYSSTNAPTFQFDLFS
jgi:hypothetical protein